MRRQKPIHERPSATKPSSPSVSKPLLPWQLLHVALSPEKLARQRLNAAKALWIHQHAWGNRPLAERKLLIAACDEVQVAYCGAGYGSWDAPPGGYRARAEIIARSPGGIEVDLVEPLMVGTGMHSDKTQNPAVLPLYLQGTELRFTTGGMHKDQPRTTIIAVPVGWLPAPFEPDTLP